MNSFLDSLAMNPVGHFSIVHALLNLAVGFALGLVIAATYRMTFSGFAYSQSFLFALVFLTSISTLVIIAIGESIARAFALAGALSIVRFRTPIKDTKDLTFLFLSLIIGLATGTGKLLIAIVCTFAISGLIILYYRMTFSKVRPNRYLLHITTSDVARARQLVENDIATSSRDLHLANATHREDTKQTDLTYVVQFKPGAIAETVASGLEVDDAVSSVSLNPLSDTVDY